MYGLIGKFRSIAGRRDDLVAIMKSGAVKMPGCLSYVIAMDLTDPDALWITEVWTEQESHKASLSIPEVAETIKKAMPLIAGFDQHTETQPIDIA